MNRHLTLAAIAAACLVATPLSVLAQQAVAPAASPAASAAAAPSVTETSGIKFDNEITTSRGAKLLLNGAGTRYKFVIKVYAAGLYMPVRANTLEAVIDLKAPRVFKVVMLRDIDGNELGKLFTDGMQKNSTREEFGKAIAGTIRMGELFAEKKKLEKGESFLIEWVPGTGTFITINGKLAVDPIKEPEFYSSLMRIWLGKSPADSNLKEALLGNKVGG